MQERCWTCRKLTDIKYRDWTWLEEQKVLDNNFEKGIDLSFDHATEKAFQSSYERVFCDKCFSDYKESKKKMLDDYLKLKILVMHERALRIMEKSKTVFLPDLKGPSEIVLKEAIEKMCFMSSHEIITAIILTDECIEYIPQYKIGSHNVDFFLPEINVVLEIDGYMHKYHKKQDSKRDSEIKTILKNCAIVRIKTNYIEQNPAMIFPAIEEMRSFQKK